MLLSFSERTHILDLLPKEGNIVTLRVISELKQKLSASEKEIKTHKIKIQPKSDGTSQIFFDKEWNTNIEIGEISTTIIKDQLQLLNSQNKLQESHIELYSKFVDKK